MHVISMCDSAEKTFVRQFIGVTIVQFCYTYVHARQLETVVLLMAYGPNEEELMKIR